MGKQNLPITYEISILLSTIKRSLHIPVAIRLSLISILLSTIKRPKGYKEVFPKNISILLSTIKSPLRLWQVYLDADFNSTKYD